MGRLIAALPFVLVASTAQAYFKTAGDLRQDIEKSITPDDADPDKRINKSYLSTGFALGYVTAVADNAEMVSEVTGKKGMCIPHGVTQGQLVAVVKKWLDAHPEHWHAPAAGPVLAALQDGFPCKP